MSYQGSRLDATLSYNVSQLKRTPEPGEFSVEDLQELATYEIAGAGWLSTMLSPLFSDRLAATYYANKAAKKLRRYQRHKAYRPDRS